MTTIGPYYKLFGDHTLITRQAIELTWASDTIIKHISVPLTRFRHDTDSNSFANLEWEFYEGTQTGATGLTGASKQVSGSWVWDNDDLWMPFQDRWATAVFTEPVSIDSTKYYWLVLKIPGDLTNARYKPGWYAYYETGSAPSGYAQTLAYIGSWSVLTNYYNKYEITDPQAGVKYHAVIDGQGYMTPDKLRSYTSQLVTSFGGNLRGGMQKHSQLQYPYSSFSQDSFRHGMGWLYFEDPQTYWFGTGLDMRVEGQTILAPLANWAPLNTDDDYNIPNSRLSIDLPWPEHSSNTVTTKKIGQSFTLAASDTIYGISILVKDHWKNADISGSLTVKLCSDSAGDPGSVLRTEDVTAQSFGWQEWIWVDFTNYTAGGASETLWITVETDADQFSSHQIWVDSSAAHAGAFKYYNGAAWVADTNYDLIFTINAPNMVQDYADPDHSAFFAEFGGDLYFAYHQKIHKWDEGNSYWTVVDTQTSKEVTSFMSFGDKLWCAYGTGHVVRYSSDGSAWSDTDYNANLLWVGKGFLWRSESANKYQLKYCSTSPEADTNWSAAVSVGTSDYDITGFCLFNDVVVVAKENALYYVDQDYLAHTYFDYTDQADADNGKNVHVWSNNVYVPIHAGLWRWTGSMVDTVGPDKRGGMPRYWHGRVADMVTLGNWLFVAYDNQNISTEYSSLLAYNGIGWHGFIRCRPRGNFGRLTALHVTTDIGGETRLWMFMNYQTQYLVLSTETENHYDWPSAIFETEGWIATPWWDGGLYNAKKYFNNVTFVADGLTSNTYIDIHYQLDGEEIGGSGIQYYLGRLDANSSNPQTFHLPDETEAFSIRLIFYFFTKDSTETPRLRSYNVEALVRPPPSYAHSFVVTIADNLRLMDGSEETATAETLWTHLKEAQAKVQPVRVHLPFKSIRGFVSALQERTDTYKEQGDTPKWERSAMLSLIEA